MTCTTEMKGQSSEPQTQLQTPFHVQGQLNGVLAIPRTNWASVWKAKVCKATMPFGPDRCLGKCVEYPHGLSWKTESRPFAQVLFHGCVWCFRSDLRHGRLSLSKASRPDLVHPAAFLPSMIPFLIPSSDPMAI